MSTLQILKVFSFSQLGVLAETMDSPVFSFLNVIYFSILLRVSPSHSTVRPSNSREINPPEQPIKEGDLEPIHDPPQFSFSLET